MRVFRSKAFSRFADRNDISERDLCDAVERASRGSIDANLGGGVIKQRIARRGAGKSGGFRAVIVFRAVERAIFLHGFAKKDIGNINAAELTALKRLAKVMLGYSETEIATAKLSGTLLEVRCNGETIS